MRIVGEERVMQGRSTLGQSRDQQSAVGDAFGARNFHACGQGMGDRVDGHLGGVYQTHFIFPLSDFQSAELCERLLGLGDSSGMRNRFGSDNLPDHSDDVETGRWLPGFAHDWSP